MALSASPIAVIKALVEVEEAVGEFIAGPEKTGLPGHIQAGYRKRCNQFSNAPGWARALLEGPAGTLGRMCQPYLDEGGYSPPQRVVPFTGGQCPGVIYRVQYRYNRINGDGSFVEPPANQEAFVYGPIRGIRGAGAPAFQSIEVNGQNGWEQVRSGNCAQGCYANIVITGVPTAFGEPDNCGNPPAELQPGPTPAPDPGPTPGPEPTTDPSNPTGAPLLPIPIYEDPIGGPTPVVGPDPNEPTIGPENIPGSFDTQPGGLENVGEPIEIDPSGGSGGDGTDFGVPPTGRAWVGCLLRFNFPSEIGAIAGSGPTNPVSPRTFGNASLVYAGGLGTAHRVNSGSMSVIRDSGALKVTGVYVNVLPGFTYTIRPISVELCPENACGET